MRRHPDMLLGDLVQVAAEDHPNRAALVSSSWRLTFGDVHARTNALAHALVARGIHRGDPVLVHGCGSVQTVLSFFSVLKANGVAVWVPRRASEDVVAAIAETHRARVLLTEACMLRELPALARSMRSVGHVVVCGVVRPDQLPSLPGIVPSEQAVLGHARHAPPPTEAVATDPAFVMVEEQGSVSHTHREALGRLPEGRCDDGSELAPVGSLDQIDLVVRGFRDGTRITFTHQRAP